MIGRRNTDFNRSKAPSTEPGAILASESQRTSKDAFGELISSLADSYENRRARQTLEWELLRRGSLRKAS